MSKIKEQDILKLLRGKASRKKLKALEKWSSESLDNAMSLESYQRIYDEANQLSSYQSIDANLEWKAFSASLGKSVSDEELLEYFDGLAAPSQRKKVEEWKDFSETNEKEFEAFNLILTETGRLSEYKKVDSDNEWMAFQESLKAKTVAPELKIVGNKPVSATKTIALPPVKEQVFSQTSTAAIPAKEVPFVVIPKEEERSNRVFMWRNLAIAASILLLGAFGWSLWHNANNSSLDKDQFLTYATAEYPEVITISDGTIIFLDKQTTLTYFKDVNLIKERSVTIDGTGEFNVASNPEKPFVLKTRRSGVGIRVLGTKFRLKDRTDFLEVIENIEGSVRAYSISDTSTYVVMTAGDIYGFDGVQFVDLRDAEDDYEGKEYDILYVLDFLMEQSGWRVTSAPYAEFSSEAIITVDLDKPYEEILEDLSRREDFEYIKMPCDGCYKVTRFTAP